MFKASTQSVCVILFLLIFLAFANALKNPFMLDDYGFFGTNAKQPLWSFFVPNRNQALGLDSPQMEKTYYRPLAHVIPLLCHRLFGAQPFGFHAVNMVLVWAAAVCVFFFLRGLKRLTNVRSWDDHDWNAFAFLGAALFALHPINGVLVNYITASVFAAQVVFMLGALFYLTLGYEGRGKKEAGRQMNNGKRSVIASLEEAKQSNKANEIASSSRQVGTPRNDDASLFLLPSSFFLPLSFLFFILALLCHETAVLLPFYAILVLRLKYPWGEVLRRVLPLLVVLVFYFMFRSWASPFSRSIAYSFSILDLSFGQKAASVIQLLSWYFQKLFLPWNIFLMWSTPFVREASWMWWVPAALSVVCGFGILIKKIPRHIFTLFAIWFALGLSPIAAGAFVTPYLGALIEPHWFVFGSIGFFATAAYGICYFLKGGGRVVIISVVIGALMALSFVNNRLWSNEQKYYEAWVKEAPYFKAVHYFLGLTHSRQGQLDDAYDHLQRAVLGRYKDWMVFMELGLIDLRLNRLDRASENLKKAYTLEQNNSGLLNAVGALAFRLGKTQEAKDLWERSIKSNPYNLEPRMNMAMYHAKTGDPKKAADIYSGIIRENPNFMPAQKALGRLQRQGS